VSSLCHGLLDAAWQVFHVTHSAFDKTVNSYFDDLYKPAYLAWAEINCTAIGRHVSVAVCISVPNQNNSDKLFSTAHKSRTERSKIECESRRRRVGFLRRGLSFLPTNYGVWESVVSSPESPDWAPGAVTFWARKTFDDDTCTGYKFNYSNCSTNLHFSYAQGRRLRGVWRVYRHPLRICDFSFSRNKRLTTNFWSLIDLYYI